MTHSVHNIVTSFIAKGSSYGKASQETRSLSFQGSSRNDRSLYENRIQILSSEATVYSLYSWSIITYCDKAGNPTITRGS
jgi:hypothetical protein